MKFVRYNCRAVRRHCCAYLCCFGIEKQKLRSTHGGISADGPSDQVARLIAPSFAKELGTLVMIANKPSANATMAGGVVTKAKLAEIDTN